VNVVLLPGRRSIRKPSSDVELSVQLSVSCEATTKVLALKVAVTVVAALIDTVQLPVPVHPPPLHPANVDPDAAIAVSATDVPLASTSVQSAPQLIPVPVTVPLPVPLLLTVSVKVFRLKVANVAAQVMFPLSVTVPVLQPVPVHPANVEPLAAVAVSATDVPLAKTSVQSAPQLIPVPVTVPLPVPLLLTVRLKLVVAAAVVAHCSFEYPEFPAGLKACTR